MRAKKVKAIKKQIYGDISPLMINRKYARLPSGQIVADRPRRMYQHAKKRYNQLGPEVLV